MENEDIAAPEGNYRDRWTSLEYDLLKHITSLSLVAIGGVVTFAGSIFAAVPDKSRLWFALASFALSGLLAFSGQIHLVDNLRRAKPPGRMTLAYRYIAAAAFGAGSGALVTFTYRAFS